MISEAIFSAYVYVCLIWLFLGFAAIGGVLIYELAILRRARSAGEMAVTEPPESRTDT